ncbi:MAG: 2,3-bisphosphoglycerate-independent phosphoglycerate mutase 2 [Methanomassiliicoccales archaeon PtaB.Bin215]|nr:MAG: 2,3-bisphosphoglycerate-independent phosphoglycerate mutase 2 [Methanomassiliicoccales archaeon PtaB.Bin215]
MRKLIILLDGAADERISIFNNRTPLEAARKDFLDGVAREGKVGTTDGKDYTHTFLLELLTGKPYDIPRGVIEAYGLELPIGEGRVAYRMTPAKVHDHNVEWYYNITCDEEMFLQRAIIKNRSKLAGMDPKILAYHGGKGVLTVKGDEILNLPKPPGPAQISSEDLGPFLDFAKGVRESTGGIALLPWGGGLGKVAVDVRREISKVPDLKVISKSPSALGVGKFLGMETHRVPGFKEGIKVAAQALDADDVFLHIEETDDISHKCNPKNKLKLIEDIDRELLRYEKRFRECQVALLIDHGASSLTGEHLRMKVPYAVRGGRWTGKGSDGFHENGGENVPLGTLLDTILED